MRLALVRLFAVTTIGTLIGCGGGNDAPTAPTSTTPTVTGITIAGYDGEITGFGQTRQLRATATMSTGQSQDVTNTATWQSDATGVATVSGTGLLRTVSAGDATITATSNGMVGRQRVTVRPPREVQPSIRASLDVGISPERLYLYRAELEAEFLETGGGVGYSVNFVNVVWRDYLGAVMISRNYNPGDLQRIWGSNYVRAGGSQGLVASIDYNRAVSRVSAEVVISISDDFGNQRQFSQTFTDSIGVTAPARIGIDMQAPARWVHPQ